MTFFMVSLLLVDLHPNKIPLFLRCQECVLELGVKNMEIKVAKIVVDVAEIKVY